MCSRLCAQIGDTKGRLKRSSSKRQPGDGEDGPDGEPKPAPVVAAPPSFNPLAASGYELARPSSGNSGNAGRAAPLEVDSHMLLDEETEFQLSRLESQQDDLEDWSRSLQHQLPTIKGV